MNDDLEEFRQMLHYSHTNTDEIIERLLDAEIRLKEEMKAVASLRKEIRRLNNELGATRVVIGKLRLGQRPTQEEYAAALLPTETGETYASTCQACGYIGQMHAVGCPLSRSGGGT